MLSYSAIVTTFLLSRTLVTTSLSMLEEKVTADAKPSKLEHLIYSLNDCLEVIVDREVIVLSNDARFFDLGLSLFRRYPYFVGYFFNITDDSHPSLKREYFNEGFTLVLLNNPSDVYVKKVFETLPENYYCRVLLLAVEPLSGDRIIQLYLWALEARINNIAVLQLEEDVFKLYTRFFTADCILTFEADILDIEERKSWVMKDWLFQTTKYDNFHTCPFKVATIPGNLGIRGVRATENGTVNFSITEADMKGKVLLAIAEYMNFTPLFIFPEILKIYDYENGTYQGITGEVIRSKSLIGVGKIFPTFDPNDPIEYSDGYETECLTWTVPAQLRNDYNIVFTEFGLETWILIVLAIALSTLVEYVFPIANPGAAATSQGFPAAFLKTFATILGQPVVPRSSALSERIHFQCYLIYAMVITVAYKTSQAQLLTINKGYQTIRTEEDIIRLNMRVGGDDYFAKLLEFQSEIVATTKKLYDRYETVQEVEEGLRRIAEDRDFAFLHYRSVMNNIEMGLLREGKDPNFYIFSECVLSHPVTFLVTRGNPLVQYLNTALRRFREHGFIDCWIDMDEFMNKRPVIQASSDVVTMSRLMPVFAVYLSGTILASIVFAVEILIRRYHS